MDTKELINYRNQLEKDVFDLLKDFYDRSGIEPDSINIRYDAFLSDEEKISAIKEKPVTISLNL